MSDVQFLSALLTATQFFLLGWFHSLLAAFFPSQLSHSSGISNILGSPRQLQVHGFLFQCLGYTHDQSSSKGLGSLLQLSPLKHSNLWLTPLHYWCCSWWSSHGTGTSNTLGSSAATRLHFHQQALIGSLHGSNPQHLCMTPSVLSQSIATEAAPSPIDLPDLLTVPSLSYSSWPIHAFRTTPPGWFLNITKSGCQHDVYLWNQLLCALRK